MAGDMPPTTPPETGYSVPEDYEFEPDEELGAGSQLLDEILTRAGEFALDTIEAVQNHPVLAASLVAAGIGAFAGLVASAVVPRRRSAIGRRGAERASHAAARAAEVVAGARLGERLGEAPSVVGRRLFATQEALGARLAGTPERLGHVAETAGERARDARLFSDTALGALGTFGRRAGGRARETAEEVADRARRDGSPDVGGTVAGSARRASYAIQLVPLGLALLRNPIVRDLLAQMIAGRLRKTARL